jgi:hypothetical protein
VLRGRGLRAEEGIDLVEQERRMALLHHRVDHRVGRLDRAPGPAHDELQGIEQARLAAALLGAQDGEIGGRGGGVDGVCVRRPRRRRDRLVGGGERDVPDEQPLDRVERIG